NQYNSAQPLSRSAVFVAEDGPHLDADTGQDTGNAADERYSGQDLNLYGGKAYAHGKSVDTGGNSQRQYGFGRVIVIQRFIFAETFLDHIGTDDESLDDDYS